MRTCSSIQARLTLAAVGRGRLEAVEGLRQLPARLAAGFGTDLVPTKLGLDRAGGDTLSHNDLRKKYLTGFCNEVGARPGSFAESTIVVLPLWHAGAGGVRRHF